MDTLSAVELARIQFGLNIAFHILFPYVVMDRITIWEAAAHPSALKVVLIGVAVVVPFIIGYSAFAYRVFRGKVTKGLYE